MNLDQPAWRTDLIARLNAIIELLKDGLPKPATTEMIANLNLELVANLRQEFNRK